MIEPIEHIARQAFAMQGGMRAEGQHASLRREIGPGLFEPVARFAQFHAARVRLQHLQSPAQRRGEAQRAVVIKPAVIEVASRHARRDARKPSGCSAAASSCVMPW